MAIKLFGTDGIRGITGERISAGVVFRVGKAMAIFCRNGRQKPKILVGRDTRTSGDMLESALCSGLTAFGADIVKLGIVPTPSLPYLIRKTGASSGIMITASHNPPEYNGLKLFDANGDKLSRKQEEEIESIIENERDYLPNNYENLGNITVDEDLLKLYADHILQLLGNVNLKDMRVYLDCSNGATFRIAPYIFKTLGATVKTISASNNGKLINVKCGSQHPEKLMKLIVKEKFDIGFCYDGDGDRVIAIGGNGEVVSGDDLLYCFAKELKKQGRLDKDTVVGTVLTNMGLEVALQNNGIKLERTDVGDKFIKTLMREQGFKLGGEESGHIILADYNFTGDGVLASALLTKILKEKCIILENEIVEIKKFPQCKIDVAVNDLVKEKIMESTELKQQIELIENELLESGRVVVRPSGTESKIRIMIEGEDEELISRLAKGLEEVVLGLK